MGWDLIFFIFCELGPDLIFLFIFHSLAFFLIGPRSNAAIDLHRWICAEISAYLLFKCTISYGPSEIIEMCVQEIKGPYLFLF
jgi:hypothetical protein